MSFTARLRFDGGTSLDGEACRTIIGALGSGQNGAVVELAAYCLMPDHLHWIMIGKALDADLLRTVGDFKLSTGFWLYKHRPGIRWQKDFFDHVIRDDESMMSHVEYIVQNPVRAGLVSVWREYRYSGGTMVDALRKGLVV